MTIEQTVSGVLDAAGMDSQTRNWPMVAEIETTPYTIYSVPVRTPENTLADGAPIANTRLQVDSYAKTYAAVKALAAQVKAAIEAGVTGAMLLMEQDGTDPSVKLYRVTQQFSIWA